VLSRGLGEWLLGGGCLKIKVIEEGVWRKQNEIYRKREGIGKEIGEDLGSKEPMDATT
jgi:hypothetical protein